MLTELPSLTAYPFPVKLFSWQANHGGIKGKPLSEDINDEKGEKTVDSDEDEEVTEDNEELNKSDDDEVRVLYCNRLT